MKRIIRFFWSAFLVVSLLLPSSFAPASGAQAAPPQCNIRCVNTAYVATVDPPTTTVPLAYVWRATEQDPFSTVSGLTTTKTDTWTLPGVKTIAVTASNAMGMVATSHNITITVGVPPTQIHWFAWPYGAVDHPFWMSAAVDPFSLTLPVTYTWAADGQVVYTMVRQTLNDWGWYGSHGFSGNWTYAAFTWTTPIVHIVQLTATNAAGQVTSIREVIVGVAPELTLTGPGTGLVNFPYTFTATASPPTATTPIEYYWVATDQQPYMEAGGLTSSVTYTWTMPGSKVLSVEGWNMYGGSFDHALFRIPVSLPILVPTLQSVASGPWNSPSTWNLGRAPLVTDIVWIQAGHTVQVSGPVMVESLVNEGTLLGPASGHLVLTATAILSNSGLIRAGDGAGFLARLPGVAPQWHPACNGTSGAPGANVVVSAAQTINAGTIQAGNGLNGGIGGSVTWVPTPTTALWNTASGIIQAGDGGNGTPGSGGGPGGDIKLAGMPFDNDGLIRAGNGGDGDQCGGAGGSTYIWGENTTNTGNILAGNGGNTTDNLATAHGGNGGNTEVWGKWFTHQGFLINLGNIAAGDGGSGNPGATVPQDAGCGGNLTLMALPLVFLSGGTHAAGSSGLPSASGVECRTPPTVRIDPAVISLAGPDTRITGGGIVLYGGADWNLDLRGLASGALVATDHITVAVGPGGTIDLRNNSGYVLQAGGEVRLYADEILLDPGVPLWALAGTEVITGPGRILYGAALVTPDIVEAAPGSTVPVPVTLVNTSPVTDTFDLEAASMSGWVLGGLPAQVTVGGLSHTELVVNVTVPAGIPGGTIDEITVQATSRSDPGVSVETEAIVLVVEQEAAGWQVFLPVVYR